LKLVFAVANGIHAALVCGVQESPVHIVGHSSPGNAGWALRMSKIGRLVSPNHILDGRICI